MALSRDFQDIKTAFLKIAQGNKNGVTVKIIPLTYERTREQENYYRKWCGEFAKFCGYSPDELHEILLRTCYGTDTFEGRFGTVLRPRRRSGQVKRSEYSELIETLIRIAAENDFIVPPPMVETGE